MATYPFWKLHGLGNDFVFFDAMEKNSNFPPPRLQRSAIAILASAAMV